MKILVLMGTRPEALKLTSVIQQLQRTAGIKLVVVSSGQHPTVVDQTLGRFGLQPDLDLKVFQDGQELPDTVGRVLVSLQPVLNKEQPDWVLVQGDTSTAVAGALAGFYSGIRVAHLEAGLRSYDLGQPFPEEANRRIITNLASLYFAPNEQARSNLIREGIDPGCIFTVGNPSLDLLTEIVRSSNGNGYSIPNGHPGLNGSLSHHAGPVILLKTPTTKVGGVLPQPLPLPWLY